MLRVIIKISLIIFIVEALIMILLSGSESQIPEHYLMFVDAGLLSLFSFYPIYYWVILPYLQDIDTLHKDNITEVTSIIENVIEGIISIDERGIIRSFNIAAEKLFGYEHNEVIGKSVNILMPKSDGHKHDGYMTSYEETGEPNIIGIGRELKGRRKDGSEFPIFLSIGEMDLVGKRMYTGIIRDITKEKEAAKQIDHQIIELEAQRQTIEDAAVEQVTIMEDMAFAKERIEEKEQLLQKVMDNTGYGIVVFNDQLKLETWNSTYLKLMEVQDAKYVEGLSLAKFCQMNLKDGDSYDLSIDEYVAEMQERIKNRADCDEFFTDRTLPSGSIINSNKKIMPDGYVITTYRDVTDERKEEERIKVMALRDGLTGLSNRRAFDILLDESVEKHQKASINFILAYIDLDNFKAVNDTHGHAVGDAALQFFAKALQNNIRQTDVAIRLGGDEFAVIFSNTDNTELAIKRLEEIIAKIKNKKSFNGFPVQIGASAGIATCPASGEDVDALKDAADTALYLAKARGKGMVCVSEAETV